MERTKGMNFYDFEDNFRADFPKHFRTDSSTQILYTTLDGNSSSFSTITLNQLIEYSSYYSFILFYFINTPLF